MWLKFRSPVWSNQQVLPDQNLKTALTMKKISTLPHRDSSPQLGPSLCLVNDPKPLLISKLNQKIWNRQLNFMPIVIFQCSTWALLNKLGYPKGNT